MPATRLNPAWRMLEEIGPQEGRHTVLDVGAHHGWFFHCWLDWCPNAEVHAFEPSAEAFDRMDTLYGGDRRVHLNQVGAGARSAELPLNVLTASKVSNSFLHPSGGTWDAIKYETGVIEQEKAQVITLDDYCSRNGIDSVYLIKIDVQGFESEVLKGAERVLGSTDYVFVEAGIERLYVGAPSFAEVHLDLEERGFHLMGMRVWHRGNYRFVETDMLFRRNGLEPSIDASRDRYYLELRQP